MKKSLFLSIVVSTFLVSPSAFALGPFIADIDSGGYSDDGGSAPGGGYTGGDNGGGVAGPVGGPSCSLVPGIPSVQQFIDECTCFLTEAVGAGDPDHFYQYLLVGFDFSTHNWAGNWSSWGFSVVSSGESTAGRACRTIIANKPLNGLNCYTRCRR